VARGQHSRLQMKGMAPLRRQTSPYANAPSPYSNSAAPTTKPLVTVVTVVKNIVRHNRTGTLKQCIESVRRQSYPHIEHLIIDGASDDETLEFLAQYEAAGALKIHSSPDKGVWDAMDKGAKLASGEFVNFLNSDDYFCDDDAIKIAMETLSRRRADWFFSGANIIRADGTSYAFPTSIYGVFSCSGIVHQTVLVRKEILIAADPFTTPYRTKENYLFMLLILNGFKYSYFPGSLVHYREGGFSANEYGGSNLEGTINDFADYFYELAGKRWRMSHSDCCDMYVWQTFGKKGLKHSLLLGLKLRSMGLRIDYFKRLIVYGLRQRIMKLAAAEAAKAGRDPVPVKRAYSPPALLQTEPIGGLRSLEGVTAKERSPGTMELREKRKSGFHRILWTNVPITPSKDATLTVDIWSDTVAVVRLEMLDGLKTYGRTDFDLVRQKTVAKDGENVDARIEDLGKGWKRIALTVPLVGEMATLSLALMRNTQVRYPGDNRSIVITEPALSPK
jgi:glycosyltransferase involved in cell wall biosynthesis